jgi:hypothetical protein
MGANMDGAMVPQILRPSICLKHSEVQLNSDAQKLYHAEQREKMEQEGTMVICMTHIQQVPVQILTMTNYLTEA